MRAVELFAGAGGLALGTARAGFEHAAMIERDPIACATLRANCLRGFFGCPPSAVLEADARDIDYAQIGHVDVVVGGPPCQPFSLGGKHRGPEDSRDMFPEAVRAVRELRPAAFLFENVKGLMRPCFQGYLQYIVLQLRYPDMVRLPGEGFEEHTARLNAQGGHAGLEYSVFVSLLNAADYGVPQRRERVFVVGLRKDLHLGWSFPPSTHSEAALLYDKWVSGEYWRRHGLDACRPESPPRKNLSPLTLFPTLELPWRTVRDAIGRLPDPRTPENTVLDHTLVEGARSYKGHTGSPYDEPAKTLKAGDHGVPGGENTLSLGDGQVRYLTVRECAILQTFPEDYVFHGSWTEQMRQIGNAVPPDLARAVAERLRLLLEDSPAARALSAG